MDRQRPPRAWSRPWLAMSAAAWLVACQGLPQLSILDPSPEPQAGWRVVERLGEARYLAPGMAGWEAVAAGSMIPAGSQITTGIGGRLIVDHASSQLSAGTGSRFILPGWEARDSVRQTAGWLRYRVATAPTAPFSIETPFLDLVVNDAVLDVTVGNSETEVAVVSGRVRVKTLDERRQIDLHAGYTGYASLQGEPLAVRRGAGRSLEAVQPIVVPALNPHRPAGAGAAPDAADTGTPAIAAFAARTPASADRAAPVAAPATTAPASPAPAPVAAMVPTDEGAAARAPRSPIVAPLALTPWAQAPVAPAVARPTQAQRAEAEAAEEIRRRFDGLTEGLLDGLPPALPEDLRRDGR